MSDYDRCTNQEIADELKKIIVKNNELLFKKEKEVLAEASKRLTKHRSTIYVVVGVGDKISIKGREDHIMIKLQIKGYLYSLKNYLLISTGLFILSYAIGSLYAVYYPEQSAANMETILKGFSWVKELDSFWLFIYIAVNNIVKGFLAMIAGVGYGLVPSLFLASNGFIIGLTVQKILETHSIVYVAAILLPHGIIEIPMIIISIAIGMKIGVLTFKWWTANYCQHNISNSSLPIRAEIKQAVTFYVTFIFPMLVIAALIEAYITPEIVRLLL